MPIIHAHRGASAYAPENTLPAFRLALEQHTDGIETDIHLTLDNRFVVCHDDEIARTSNGEGKIQDMTVEQLKQYDFGVKFAPLSRARRSPPWTSCSRSSGTSTRSTSRLRVRSGRMRTWRRLIGCCMRRWSNSAVWSGRCFRVSAHSLAAGSQGAVSGSAHRFALRRRSQNAGGNTRAGADLQRRRHHPYLHSINKDIVDTCLAHGIDVNVWTVDSPEDIATAVSYGVTGIITNVPDRVRAYCEEHA